MREKKREMNLYQPCDGEAMAAHLEKRAAKGWHLEKLGPWGLTYGRGEPKTVRYTVTYFPEASVFDGVPGERQETYIDYCAAAGWELAASQAQIQIFRSERENPVPIETDEGVKLDAIHKTMKKSLLWSYALLLVAMGLNLWNSIRGFVQNLPLSLSSNNSLGLLLLVGIMVLHLVIALADYGVWYARSRRSVAAGGACVRGNSRLHMAGQYVLLTASALFLLVLLLDISSPRKAVVTLYAVVGMAVIVTLSNVTVKRLRRRKGRSVGVSWAIYIGVAVLLTILYTAGVIFVAIWVAGNESLDRKPVATYTTDYGAEWDLYRDELPVTLEDLGYAVTAEDACTYECEEERSILLARRTYRQRSYNHESGLPDLRYQIFDIPWDWLRERVADWCRNYEEDRLVPVEGSPWDAEGVYADRRTFLLVKGERLAWFSVPYEIEKDLFARAWE